MELEGLVFVFVFFWGRARRERERERWWGVKIFWLLPLGKVKQASTSLASTSLLSE